MAKSKWNNLKGLIAAAGVAGVIFFLCIPVSARDDGECDENRPDRLITMAAEYPGVEIPMDEEEVRIDLIFHNKGRSDEDVDILITDVPENWKARVKTYQYSVNKIHAPSGEDKTVTFEAEPDKKAAAGKYKFRIEAQTRDGEFKMAQNIFVTVLEKIEGEKESRGVKLTTSYPVLRGPSDGNFEFSMEVESKLDKDAIFDLFGQGPEGWDINFKPAYESKYISSLRLKENQNSTVAVEVKPARKSEEGEFPINVKVSSGDARAEAELTVILTGTYKLEVGTVNDLLSLEAKQGKPANVSVYVKNTGSAANKGIEFMSFKPENWNVEFKPEMIDVVEPGDMKQVEVMITPYEEALVGDYSVTVNVEGEKVTKPVEFRVTVKASSAWAWIGIGVIVLVILSLTALFQKLGRR